MFSVLCIESIRYCFGMIYMAVQCSTVWWLLYNRNTGRKQQWWWRWFWCWFWQHWWQWRWWRSVVLFLLSLSSLSNLAGYVGFLGTNVLQIRNWLACCIFAWQMFHLHSLGGSTALCCMKGCHGRHLKILTSVQKSESVSRCVFTWRTSLPNFIPIRLETTEP